MSDLTRTDVVKLIATQVQGGGLNSSVYSILVLRGVNLEDLNLSKLDLSRANLSMANLKGTDLSSTDLFRANLSMQT